MSDKKIINMNSKSRPLKGKNQDELIAERRRKRKEKLAPLFKKR
ncbi:hypothetical protein [Bacillus sp. AFS040349]|nr:hypothetical protein [Bacillus sp. AFS040349]